MVIKKITLPTKVANLYLNLREDLNLPPLKGISAAPLLSDHGSIHCSAGYDKASGLWCTGVEMPLVLPKPTFEAARKALRAIRTVFASFPFADSVRTEANLGSSVDQSRDPGLDESSFLIALLTALCRPSLPLAPALLIRAPQLSGSGTGKGLLVHAISEIAFGQKSEAFTSRGERQELCKRIESTLLQSRPMLFLDNCNHETLVSNVLAQAITEPFVSTRALGQSKMISLSSTTFIVVTGNAVQISEDLARRFLVVSLDAKCEHPEQRRFDSGFEAAIHSRRSELMAALLTIWRWGRQNSLPSGAPLGSFDQWAAWCRDPLLALGCADPVLRIADLKAQEPKREEVTELFQAWYAVHGSAPVKFCDLDPRVGGLLLGNPQSRVSRLRSLEGTRVGGFVLEGIKPVGRWGKKHYAVRWIG